MVQQGGEHRRGVAIKIVWMTCSVVQLFRYPNFLVKRMLLDHFKYHVGGSLLAMYHAVRYGYAIQIGGGFHHAYREDGGGFCYYADISLMIWFYLRSFRYDKDATGSCRDVRC